MGRRLLRTAIALVAAPLIASAAEAQPIGSFRWQLQPYCNVVTLSVTQNGSVFRLEGTDDQCGAGGSASVTGTAFQNPGGGIGFGLNIVSAPGGAPVHVDATVSLPSLSGTWRDSAGSSGNFVFTPGAGSGGSARATGGTIGGVSINPAQVQLRVSGSCTTGLFMQSIGQNGTVGCAAASAGGGITSVSAGPGLFGGGTTGNLVLRLQTAGPGAYSFENVNGLVAHGNLGVGGIGDTGPGTRLLWYPGKAAFRVGHTSSGQWDDASVGTSSVAMGLDTVASGGNSTALGASTLANGGNSTAMGASTTASGQVSTAMGSSTTASGHYATAMGANTIATGNYSTAFGNISRAVGSGSLVAGTDSVAGGVDSIALGLRVNANGIGSVVIGSDATATTTGTFMYGDRSTPNDLTTLGSNEFLVRAAGGTIFYSNAAMTSGVILVSGTNSWAPINVSDENRKTGFRDFDGELVLGKLAAMPVREWSYTTQDAAIRHVGPTAQDFRAAFGLGESDVRIGSVDADGIALAAVKALETRTRELRDENRALHEALVELRRELEALKRQR